MDKLNNLLIDSELDVCLSNLSVPSSASNETVFNDRPLSPVLNKSNFKKKTSYRRRSNRINSKVKLNKKNPQDDNKITNTSLEIENELNTSFNLSVEERVTKIKQLERTKRKLSDIFHNTPVENPKHNILVSEHNFKKPVSPAPSKKRVKRTPHSLESESIHVQLFEKEEKSNFMGFQTGSGKSIVISPDKIQKHINLFEGILSSEELDTSKSNFALYSQNQHSNEKISSNTLLAFLESSMSDTQMNLATDVAMSCLSDNLRNDVTNTEHRSYKNVDEVVDKNDFIGFRRPLWEDYLVATHKKLIERIKNTKHKNLTGETLIITKRKLSSSHENLNKKFKYDTASDNDEALTEANVLSENERILKEQFRSFFEDIISNTTLKTPIQVLENLPHLSEKSSFKTINCNSNITNPVFTGFNTAGGKTIQISNDSLTRANRVLENLPDIPDQKYRSESKRMESKSSITSTGFSSAAGKSIVISNEALKKANRVLENLPNLPLEESFKNGSNDLKITNAATGFDTASGRSKQISNDGLKIPVTSTGFCTAGGKTIKISYDALTRANRVLENLPDIPDQKFRSESKSVESKSSTLSSGFSSAAGKSILISNEALQKANGVLENLPNLPLEESFKNSSNDFKITNAATGFDAASGKSKQISNDGLKIPVSSTGFSTAGGKTIQISNDALTRANRVLENLPDIPDQKFRSESKSVESKSSTLSSGFSSAAGKNISISNEALKKANRVLKNLPNLPLEESFKTSKDLKTSATGLDTASGRAKQVSNDGLKIPIASTGFSTAGGNTIEISNVSLEKASELLDNLPMNHNFEGNIPTCGVGFATAGGRNIVVSNDALIKANNILAKTNTFEDNLSINEKVLPQPFSEKMYDEASDKTVNDSSKTSSDLNDFNLSINTVDHFIEDFDLHKSKAVNTASNKENKSVTNKSYNNKKFVSPLNHTRTSTPKRTLGFSISKQIIVPKENLQKAMKIFEDGMDLKKTFTSSTPVKDVFQQNNLTSERNNRATLFNNMNITPIKSTKSVDVAEENQFLNTCCDDYSSPILIKNQITSQNYAHSVELQLEILRIRMQALESQNELLKNDNFVHNNPNPGILFLKKKTSSKITWKDFVENQKPGCISINEAINSNVSKSVLMINPSNAEFINFNCNWNAKEQQVVVNTYDGAVVIPNLNNLIGLKEISDAFKVMPGVDPKLIPEGWIPNHFKWIVWKLASLERNFPNKFPNYLSIENIIQQLKYRYDREIDNAERPALRKIMEKDDVPQKRLVLCVVDIIQTTYDMFELQLTDGWYSIRTIIDKPLSKQVKNNKIIEGTKLITEGAELLNCDGCHPLQVSDAVRLKITYNSTRRANWDLKLGYQKYPEPFPIYLTTILPDGGLIGCLKIYVARVYPLKYMEKEVSGRIVWRNKKAEDKRAEEWEIGRSRTIESIRCKLQEEFEIENNAEKTKMPTFNPFEISEINSPQVLYQMMESTNDPEGLRDMLSVSQIHSAINYKTNYCLQQQQELSARMSEELKSLKLASRNVTPVLTLRVSDALDLQTSKVAYNFSIYKPTEEHIQSITEGSTFFVYNVLPRQSGDLTSNSRTHFKLESTNVTNTLMQRCIVPISEIALLEKPILNEYDTYGTIIQLDKQDQTHAMWITDFSGRLLHVKVAGIVERCCLLDNLSRGHNVALMNLIFCSYKNNYAEAIAYQSTVITSYPQHILLQNKFNDYCKRLPKDLTTILLEYDKKIESWQSASSVLRKNRNSSCSSNLEISHQSNMSQLFDETCDDSTIIPSRLTTTDIAMSLIDTDQFFENL